MDAKRWVKQGLLRAWRDLPLPPVARKAILRTINPTFLVGAVACIEKDGRVLLLEHTYRTHCPWGLPGGWVKRHESPQVAVRREVLEETGFDIDVEGLVAIDIGAVGEVGMLFRCRVVSGAFRGSEEAHRCGWFSWDELPPLPSNQSRLLALGRQGVTPPP